MCERVSFRHTSSCCHLYHMDSKQQLSGFLIFNIVLSNYGFIVFDKDYFFSTSSAMEFKWNVK